MSSSAAANPTEASELDASQVRAHSTEGDEVPRQGSRPRGHFWEVTYAPAVPTFRSWTLKKGELSNDTGKTEVTISAEPGTRAVNLKHRTFATCDFNHFNLSDSSFSQCQFVDCLFVKGTFINVKFSGCYFDKCHFLNVRFERCQFIKCTFSTLSASAQHLQFEATAISATSFLNALQTNLDHLPEGITKEYQQHRLLLDQVRLARSIFLSVREEPELDHLFDANRNFELLLQKRKIAESRHRLRGSVLEKQGCLSRWLVCPVSRAGLVLIHVAGYFTDWGRSPFRSLWYLVVAVLFFGSVYALAFGQGAAGALLRSLDCALVFGYSKYVPDGAEGSALGYVMFANAFVGFWWYALLIPALSRRLFR